MLPATSPIGLVRLSFGPVGLNSHQFDWTNGQESFSWRLYMLLVKTSLVSLDRSNCTNIIAPGMAASWHAPLYNVMVVMVMVNGILQNILVFLAEVKNKQAMELYALINYGELRRKIGGSEYS